MAIWRWPASIAYQKSEIDAQRREEIGNLLIPALKSNDERMRTEALRAAEYRATPADIPALLEALQQDTSYSKGTIIKALGTTGGNEKAAAVLAKLMETNSRYDAVKGLTGMKKYVEPVVLPLVQSSDGNVRRDAIGVLAEVGGKKSLQTLEGLLNTTTKDDQESFAMKQALEKIKSRLAVQPD